MPNNLTDTEEVRLLDLSWQNTDKLALMAVLGGSEEGTAGTEVSGGSYARQTAAANAASTTSGVSTKTNSGAPSFTCPATDVQGWELWDSAGSARKWYGLFNRQLASATASTDKINATAHGLLNGQKVVFSPGTVPAGLSAGTAYFVVNKGTNDFQVSATSGGSAIDITADMAVVYFGLVFTMTAGGTLSVAAGAISISLE